MKLNIKLVGIFNRTPIDSVTAEAVTPQQWMRSLIEVASQVRQRSPSALRQKFGMNYLSELSIDRLLKQAHSGELDSIPLWRQPVEAIEARPILYRYQFVSQEAQIELQTDDPQLPYWEDEIAGIYEIVVEGDTYAGVSPTWLDAIWLEAKQQWDNYCDRDRLEIALQSSDNNQFSFYLENLPRVKVTVDIQQLSPEIQEAITFLKKGIKDIRSISSTAVELISEYRQDFSIALPKLELETPTSSEPQFIIGKRISRRAIEELIDRAEQFLFISSYIIEDRSIVELICQKATTLPQGVWILTDLNHEVIDAIDTQVEDIPRSREAYQASDEKKALCLKLLLTAGARIRGGAFHLKTYITEKAAYLGSCNLTGGSLDFNLESGLICWGDTTHQDLVRYFTRCWEHLTKYDVLRLQSGFNQRTLNNSSPDNQFNSHLLTPRQYRQDLYRELSKNSGIEIYSRGFYPDAEILNLLTGYTRVYADGFIRNQNPRIRTYFKKGIHAKITLIDDRVAYLGGVNFQFAPRGLKTIDLMYKTCDRQQIARIRQQLAVSSL